MTNLCGRWTLQKNDHWDEYMKAVGVGIILRKIAANLTTHEEIKQEETGEWVFNITSSFKNVYLRFKVGEEFDETTADGRRCKSIFELVDGGTALQERQKVIQGGVVDSIITRKVQADGTMLCTLEAIGKDVTCYRIFTRS